MVLLLARKESWSLKGKAKCFSFQLSSLGNPCFQPPQSPSGQMTFGIKATFFFDAVKENTHSLSFSFVQV